MKKEQLEEHIANIERVVCNHYDVSIEDIKGRSNKMVITFPRSVIMHMVHSISSLSDREIGAYYDRTKQSVRKNLNKVALKVSRNDRFRSEYNILRFRVHPGMWYREIELTPKS